MEAIKKVRKREQQRPRHASAPGAGFGPPIRGSVTGAGLSDEESDNEIAVDHSNPPLVTLRCCERQARAPKKLTCRGQPLLKLTRPPRTPGGEAAGAAWGGLRLPTEHQPRTMPTKWAAVGPDSETADVLDLLTRTWQLQWPHVIISVTGAAVGHVDDLSPATRAVVQRGLLDAVRATKAWVVTGGTDGGVVRLVGEAMAYDDHLASSVCLGVATWGIVKDHERLGRRNGIVRRYDADEIASRHARHDKARAAAAASAAGGAISAGVELLLPGHVGEDKAPAPGVAIAGAPHASRARRGSEPPPPPSGPRALLEPHHTHFLFVDAGPDAEGQVHTHLPTSPHRSPYIPTSPHLLRPSLALPDLLSLEPLPHRLTRGRGMPSSQFFKEIALRSAMEDAFCRERSAGQCVSTALSAHPATSLHMYMCM